MEEIPSIVIADIHGELGKLERLLSRLERRDLLAGRRLVFTGDYPDRGAESKGVIDLMISLVADGAVALRGNHDATFLKVLTPTDPRWEMWCWAWLTCCQPYATLISYGLDLPRAGSFTFQEWMRIAAGMQQVVPPEHVEFLRSLPYYHETTECVMIHAGLLGDKTWEEQRTALDQLGNGFGLSQPRQIFDHQLAEAQPLPHRAYPKWLVTGHLTIRRPQVCELTHRVRLNCLVKETSPLVAWVSDLNIIVSAT